VAQAPLADSVARAALAADSVARAALAAALQAAVALEMVTANGRD
jgi:hypothetical protein